MKNQLLFSIIIPTYNRASILGKTIQSVIDQRYGNWELIIVDDASTDNTKELVETFKDKRIRYYQKEHGERSEARNFGFKNAFGTYICFVDSDDLLLEEHLEAHFAAIRDLNFPIAAFYSGSYVAESEKRIDYPYLFEEDQPLKNLWFKGYNALPFSFHKEIIKEIKFDETLNFMEDIHFLIGVIKNYPIYPIAKKTNIIVHHPERSLVLRFKSELIEHWEKHKLAYKKITTDYGDYLSDHLTDKEIHRKMRVINLQFLKASIKSFSPRSFLFFARQILK